MCKNSSVGSDSTVVLLQVMYFSGGKFNTRQLPLIVLNIEAYIAFSVSIRYMSRSGVLIRTFKRSYLKKLFLRTLVLITPAKSKCSGVQGSEIICRL